MLGALALCALRAAPSAAERINQAAALNVNAAPTLRVPSATLAAAESVDVAVGGINQTTRLACGGIGQRYNRL